MNHVHLYYISLYKCLTYGHNYYILQIAVR